MKQVLYVPWLRMHQPPVWHEGEGGEKLVGDLFKMITGPPNSEKSWNGRIFARSSKNPARYALRLAEAGLCPRIVLDCSGCLLKEVSGLSSSGFLDALEAERALGRAEEFPLAAQSGGRGRHRQCGKVKGNRG